MKMVNRDLGNIISEGESELNIINRNGKRVAEIRSKDKDNKRIKTKSLYRQPTANELNRLQETENLYNSNLFRLQIEEIIKEVKVKEKIANRFQEWFSNFKEYLLAIAEDDIEYDLSEKNFENMMKVKIPINRDVNVKVMFKFHKFKDVEIVGSYKLGCCINSKLVIDLQITIPAETFTKNDSINYKYHKKRAAYLAYITSHLNKLETIESLQYSCVDSCETKPIIVIKPCGKLGKHLSIYLNLTCEAEAYKLQRFCPSRNNLRESWLLSSEKQEGTETGPPTPYYNSGILSDLTAYLNQEFLTKTIINSENLKQAIILLKIWIRQRNLQVSGHVISMLIGFLVQSKRINNIMSSYQIIRNVWIALKSSEWDTKGISLCKVQETPLEEFHRHFPVVFIDMTGSYNICWQMCKGTYCALRRESALAVEMLDNQNINSFMRLFMTPVPALTQFDHILRFKNLEKVKESILERTPMPTKVNYGLDHLALITNTLYNLLSKGLGNRVDLALNIVEANLIWPVNKSLEKAKKNRYKENLSFGFILNPENAINIVDKGPPANLPEAEEFRSFWGDKSELRRFQDGAIAEACVWRADSLAERRDVSRQIIDYLLLFKYDIPPSELFHVCSHLNELTARKSAEMRQVEETSLTVLQAFDELRRDLRSLEQLPLDVTAVYGVSPVFSYCEPFPALGATCARAPRRCNDVALLHDGARSLPEYAPANRAVMELSHSGKWPGDIDALRCLKAAFHLQIAEQLKRQFSLRTHAYAEHVDVLKRGFVFRLRVAHAKEITLAQRTVEKGVTKYQDTEESVRLHCDTVLLPRLRGALHGLYQKHPAYGPAACLFKRWLACHLFSYHFPPTVAELLVATVFLLAAPHVPPVQPTVAFLRVLKLLVDTDWSNEMILLDFNDDMSNEEVTKVERKFKERDSATHAMFIATAYDGELSAPWSRERPARPVVVRAQAIARGTLDYVEKAFMDDMEDNILGAFVPSLRGYDVLIHLEPKFVPLSSETVHARPTSAMPRTTPEDFIPVVEFHPVDRYLDELRSAYEQFALFFNDRYGGDVVAVLWKPDIHQLRDLQISNANALRPVSVDGETKYRVNIDAIIEDFRILGRGLVRDVVVNSTE